MIKITKILLIGLFHILPFIGFSQKKMGNQKIECLKFFVHDKDKRPIFRCFIMCSCGDGKDSAHSEYTDKMGNGCIGYLKKQSYTVDFSCDGYESTQMLIVVKDKNKVVDVTLPKY